MKKCGRVNLDTKSVELPVVRSFRSGGAAYFSAVVVKTPEVFSSNGVFHFWNK
jgi:hypothetical protein